ARRERAEMHMKSTFPQLIKIYQLAQNGNGGEGKGIQRHRKSRTQSRHFRHPFMGCSNDARAPSEPLSWALRLRRARLGRAVQGLRDVRLARGRAYFGSGKLARPYQW